MYDDNTPVHDDIITILKQILKETFGEYFHAYYEGDPIAIPKSNLPAIVVEKLSGDIDLGATGMDVFRSQINIRVLLDKADDLNADDKVDITEQKLRRIVEGRHPETGEYLPATVLGIVRKNITLKGHTLSSKTDVAYRVQPRPGEIITSEALVQIVTTEHLMVSNRT